MIKKIILAVSLSSTALCNYSYGFNVGGSLGDLGNTIKREAGSCIRGGCNPGKAIKNGLRDGVGDIAGEAADEVAEAIIRAADHVFDKQIDPLVERLDVIVKETISRGGAEVELRAQNIINNAVDDIVGGFDPWFREAIRVADQFSPEEIEEHLINTTFDRLDNLENRLFQHADELLSKVDVVLEGRIRQLDCFIDGTKDDIIMLIRNKYGVDLIPNPFEGCRRETGTRFKYGPQLSNGEVYLLNKCRIQKEINKAVSDDQSIEYIVTKYSDLMNLAAEMQCIERRGFSERYVRDWLRFSEKAQIWFKYY